MNEENIEMLDTEMTPLSVGDKISNFKFKYYQDGKFQDAQMSDYEGK
jgi:hypothetical protein